jgi:hypothetical protein
LRGPMSIVHLHPNRLARTLALLVNFSNLQLYTRTCQPA